MMTPSTQPFTVNGRSYRPPARPVAVICLDGSADEYLDAALARGLMPNLQRLSIQGYRGMARGAMPSFTNVNNSSIITGVPPSVHGIGGNFFFEKSSGQEVMMNSSRFLRCDTILAAAARAGRRIGVVTAKEKLRDILAAGLSFDHDTGPVAFSSEKAKEAKSLTHGVENAETLVNAPTPAIYSGEASLYVLRAGVAMLRRDRADFLYLSTTDFIQHKHAPTTTGALEFYAGIDRELGHLLELGAVVGLTADHGMNAKQNNDGTPKVVYVESELVQRFGPGFRVILPITDPYVVHHGALGSFAVVHLPEGFSESTAVMDFLTSLPGVTEVHAKAHAAVLFELPEDRMGDLIVVSGRDTVLGRTPRDHDLKAIEGGLRSHGGRYEEMVPFVMSEPLNAVYAQRAAGDVRNFEVFEFALNGGN